MQIDVVSNAKRNLTFGILNRIILLICPFAERTVINYVLGSQYLGLGSLFTSIITMLSISELGFNAAVVYNMYKPAAEGNVRKINTLLNFYRKVYRIIGTAILLIGLLLIPFLPKLIKGSCPADISLTKLYLIYLGNTGISYFLFAYMSSLIVVHQRDDVKSMINTIVRVSLTLSQIIVLLVTKNYYLFALMMPVFTVVNNLLMCWRVRTMFPQYRAEGLLDDQDKKAIKKHVTGTFIHQTCQVTRNTLDSICISAFLGLVLTAIYNNYYLVLNAVTVTLSLISSSFAGGVGNHVATRSVKENYEEMKKLDFVYLWVSGWCMICMLCLYQPFEELWMGREMLLPMSAVILMCLYFYMLKLGDIRALYLTANGLWWEQRYRALGETALNLILNVLLGKFFGVHGIILATMISLFLCNYLWAAVIAFRKYFSLSRLGDYYRYQGKQSILTFGTAGITYAISRRITVSSLVIRILIIALICIFIPNGIFIAVYRKSDAFQYVKRILLKRS